MENDKISIIVKRREYQVFYECKIITKVKCSNEENNFK